VMIERRLNFPYRGKKSQYQYSFVNHPLRSPEKIKPKLSMNLEKEAKDRPIAQLTSFENSLYQNDYSDTKVKANEIRKISCEHQNGFTNKYQGKKAHIDMDY
jgi:hypothetical protein